MHSEVALQETSRERISQASGKAETVMYGLPCADCKAYYSSQLEACPICKCTERVSPNAGLRRATVAF